jgi:hypothetical protein
MKAKQARWSFFQLFAVQLMFLQFCVFEAPCSKHFFQFLAKGDVAAAVKCVEMLKVRVCARARLC